MTKIIQLSIFGLIPIVRNYRFNQNSIE